MRRWCTLLSNCLESRSANTSTSTVRMLHEALVAIVGHCWIRVTYTWELARWTMSTMRSTKRWKIALPMNLRAFCCRKWRRTWSKSPTTRNIQEDLQFYHPINGPKWIFYSILLEIKTPCHTCEDHAFQCTQMGNNGT